MHQTTLDDLAAGLDVVPGKGYARIRAGKRTIAYANERRAGIQLDFRAADLTGAPARLRKRTIVKRDRALLTVTGKNVEGARALLQHVAQKAGA